MSTTVIESRQESNNNSNMDSPLPPAASGGGQTSRQRHSWKSRFSRGQAGSGSTSSRYNSNNRDRSRDSKSSAGTSVSPSTVNYSADESLQSIAALTVKSEGAENARSTNSNNKNKSGRKYRRGLSTNKINGDNSKPKNREDDEPMSNSMRGRLRNFLPSPGRARASSAGPKLKNGRRRSKEDGINNKSAAKNKASDGDHDKNNKNSGNISQPQGEAYAVDEVSRNKLRQKQEIKERDGFCRRVDTYDGQVVVVEGKSAYELGNYLGGGVAGVVYEGLRLLPMEEYPVRNGTLPQQTDSSYWNDTTATNPTTAPSVSTSFLCSSVDAEGMNGQIISTPPRPTNEDKNIFKDGHNNSMAMGTHAIEATRDISLTDGYTERNKVLVDRIDAPSRSQHATRMAATTNKEATETATISQGNARTNPTKSSVIVSQFGGLIDETVAIKILNPVGFRILPVDATSSAVVVQEGDPFNGTTPMTDKNVWWLVNPNSRNLRTLQRFSSPGRDDVSRSGSSAKGSSRGHGTNSVDRGSPEKGLRLSLVAAYSDPNDNGAIKELPLTKCIEIWGHAPFNTSDVEFETMIESIERINAGKAALPSATTPVPSPHSLPFNNDGPVELSSARARTGLYRAVAASRRTIYCPPLDAYIAVPVVPPKYLRWLRQRRAATKEIRNMMLIGRHRNVVHLYEVLEYIQESKSTMFLILELVRGGELFDLISSSSSAKSIVSDSSKNNQSNQLDDTEVMMRKFFLELASGIHYCHINGIAHRDLKPENLLVHNGPNGESTLKIADFGLSATFGTETVTSDQETFVGSILSAPTSPTGQSHSNNKKLINRSDSTKGNDNATVAGLDTGCQPCGGGSGSNKSPLNQLSAFGATALSYLSCGNVVHVTCDEVIPCAPFSNVDDQLPSPLRRMTSIVGSPHYVAPEIISQTQSSRNNSNDLASSQNLHSPGYDGTKADVWSAGVILYAMLFRSLPFGEDLLRCPRYQSFTKWYNDARRYGGRRSSGAAALNPVFTEADEADLLGPHWFFPSESSRESRDLIIAMLNPDPRERLSIQMVLQHPWLLNQ